MTRMIWVAEFRSVAPLEGGAAGRVMGHASVFNEVAQVRDGYEQIAPEAFARALAEKQDVSLLLNHNPDNLLARTSSGTLRLGTDSRGLTVDADLAPTTLGKDVQILLDRGDLSKMSFGFIPKAHRFDEIEGVRVRTYTDVDLFDVSIVTDPAYSGTNVALRHRDTIVVHKSSNKARTTHTRIRVEALLAQKEGK